MEIELAIKILHPDTSINTLTEIEYYAGFNGKQAAIEALNEASLMACEALGRLLFERVK